MEELLVSIVVPTYNRGELLKRTIDSVLKQTYGNFELIIVDDASTDNTEEIVKEYNDNRIKFLKLEENTKGTMPRNIGITKSIGQYIALLDSDDEWLPSKLEKQLNFIKKYSGNNVVCFTDLIVKKDNGQVTYSKNKVLEENQDIIDYMFINNDNTWVQASTYMFSAEIGKNTLFDSNLKKHQDIDFCLRLRNNGAKFVSLPEHLTIYNHEIRDDRVGNNNKVELSIEWIERVKEEISDKAYYSFFTMFIVNHLILKNKKLSVMKIYFKSFLSKSINLKSFLKGIIKCILPKKVFKHILKKRYTIFE